MNLGEKMAKSLLIRNVDDDDIDWLESSIPAGVSREKYLKGIIEKARKDSEDEIRLQRKEVSQGTPKFKFIDLFAGIGGFHIGMRLNGGECVFANEWDKYSAQTYRAWTGSDHLNTDDLRELLVDLQEKFDSASPHGINSSNISPRLFSTQNEDEQVSGLRSSQANPSS